MSGPAGPVRAAVALANGDLAVVGSFRIADGSIVNNVARWDGQQWRALGTGIPNSNGVRCLARASNGDLVVGGTFTQAGGVPAVGVARWNGTTWSAVGSGVPNVSELLALPNGELIATSVSPGSSVMRWNGATWSPVGNLGGQGGVLAVARLANGDLLVAGEFVTALGQGFALQSWNGATWQPVPGFDAGTFPHVDDVAVRPNGDVVLTGSFSLGGVAENCAVWNGTTITPLAPPVTNLGVRTLLTASNGDVLIGSGTSLANVARWDGATWQSISSFPDGPGQVVALAEDPAGRIVAVGAWYGQYPHRAPVYRFDGTSWSSLGADTPPVLRAMTRRLNGDVVVGGSFTSLGGSPANSVAVWNGTAFSALGSGVIGAVTALATAANGDVIAGGAFNIAGGVPALNIARWNGQAWSPIGAGIPLPGNVGIKTIAVAGNGDVLAGLEYSSGVQRFDGQQWQPLVFPTYLAGCNSLVTLPNGDVLLVGWFPDGLGGFYGVMRYSGGNLTPEPGAPTFGGPAVLAEDGSVLAAFGTTVHRFDGVAWTPLPGSAPNLASIGELPNGELVGGGISVGAIGGGAASSLYRYRSGTWESWGELTGGRADAVLATPRGEVWVVGSFWSAGAVVCAGLARGIPTCPATSVSAGAGCSGGAGPVALVAQRQAWVGGALRAEASGMTANSLALQVLGLQATQLPLPFGAPGCSLLVQPLLTGLLLPAAGKATALVPIPNQPSLVGQQFRLQVVGVELGGVGIVQTTGTNALDVSIGAL